MITTCGPDITLAGWLVSIFIAIGVGVLAWEIYFWLERKELTK